MGSNNHGHATHVYLQNVLIVASVSFCHIIFLLQLLDPSKRLGCEQMGGYGPLKEHQFFEDIDWDTLAEQTPPKLMPYLPSSTKGEQGFRSEINVSLCDLKLTCTCMHMLMHIHTLTQTLFYTHTHTHLHGAIDWRRRS